MSFLAASAASLTFPVGLVAAMSVERAAPSLPRAPWRASPFATLAEHVGMQLASAPRLAFVACVYWYSLRDYRSFAATLEAGWVLRGIARDVLLALAVGGVTDFLLLADASPFRAAMRPHKFNAAYPRLLKRNATAPVLRDVAWSASTAALAGALEALVLHAYATGRAAAPALEADAWWSHAPTLLLMVTWFYTQSTFYGKPDSPTGCTKPGPPTL